ncbi:hypothetical protein G6F61_014919 [Rhizopus arrhizus]|nr:hypothetical protein G6F61_014919 [Rhizopus arrhizus]
MDICCCDSGRMARSTWPPPMSCISGAPPLYGTCVNCSLAAFLNISPAKWPGVPAPAEPMLVLSPCARMYAISSCTLAALTLGPMTSTFGTVAKSVTGLKSFTAA